jgi:hypothetical protein
MRKFAIVCALALVIGSAVGFAEEHQGFGIGAVFQGGYYGAGGGNYGPALSLKIPSVPVYWGANFGFSQGEYLKVGITGDTHIFYDRITSQTDLNWFLGVGGYFSLISWGKSQDEGGNLWLAGGFRIPVGLSWNFGKHFELFADVAPLLGIGFKPFKFPDWGVGGDIGLRVWTK